MKLINVGFGNMVAASRVVAVASNESSPIKRLVQEAKDNGRVVDVTCGRKTRSVIITDAEFVLLSALQPETVSARLMQQDNAPTDAEDLANVAE